MQPIAKRKSHCQMLGVLSAYSIRGVLLMFGSLVLVGCSAARFTHAWWQHNFNINGAVPTVDDKNYRFSQVDLVSALTCEGNIPQECTSAPDSTVCLERSFQGFYGEKCEQLGACSGKEGKADQLRCRRNEIQDRLLAASDAACGDFLQQLNTLQTNTNLLFGLSTIATGAAGAITTVTTAARALSGSAAAISGARGEWNTDVFAKQMVPTLTKAIRKDREQWKTALTGKLPGDTRDGLETPSPTPTPTTRKSTKAAEDETTSSSSTEKASTTDNGGPENKAGRQSLPIDRYSVEAAIGDAISYNDRCSLENGLAVVNASVDVAASPGLDKINETLDKLKITNQKLAQLNGGSSPTATPTATPTSTP